MDGAAVVDEGGTDERSGSRFGSRDSSAMIVRPSRHIVTIGSTDATARPTAALAPAPGLGLARLVWVLGTVHPSMR